MTYQQLDELGQEKAHNLLGQLELEQVKEAATIAFNDMSDAAQSVLEWVLVHLETRMPETEYVTFLDTLD